MSRKLMKFLILFDNSNLLFFPGQFLSGRVILEVDDDMPVLGKSIIFSLLLLFACYLFGMGLHYETCLNDLYIRVRLFFLTLRNQMIHYNLISYTFVGVDTKNMNQEDLQ